MMTSREKEAPAVAREPDALHWRDVISEGRVALPRPVNGVSAKWL
ncbi:MAG TPA: hypothetical protein VH158_06305 [Gemmatimonadales bacterium]|jgi:hypothetical protein|nr:hypothetical protein [Gemmatimonadales bacterium]